MDEDTNKLSTFNTKLIGSWRRIFMLEVIKAKRLQKENDQLKADLEYIKSGMKVAADCINEHREFKAYALLKDLIRYGKL